MKNIKDEPMNYLNDITNGIQFDPELDLKTSSYDYHLPTELIAQRAQEKRDESRLLVYNEETDEITHTKFSKLADFLPVSTQLVLNKSKVFPCRFLAKKKTGAAVEVFLLSLTPVKDSECDKDLFEVFLKSSGKKKIGDEYICENIIFCLKKLADGKFYVSVNLNLDDFLDKLHSVAKVPIPPYIRGGKSDDLDRIQYQTIYAKELGSVAAPTAGLHFTEDVFKSLDQKGIGRSFVTLHVGAGTFKPVKDEDLEQHRMHSEVFNIDKSELTQLNNKKDSLIAVGTTSLRVLETALKDDEFRDLEQKSTDIFLHPGVEVKSIRGLITNFHLPKSTLIMLVASLIGRAKTLELYNLAVKEKYRFFSYGDSMLILRKKRG